MSTISTNTLNSVATTLNLGVQGNVKATVNSANQFASVIPGAGNTLYPEFKCRAWVLFDGVATPPVIRQSGNVSSVVQNASGNYDVNLTTPMVDDNFAVSITQGNNGTLTGTTATDNAFGYEEGGARTSSKIRVRAKQDDAGATVAREFVSVLVFR